MIMTSNTSCASCEKRNASFICKKMSSLHSNIVLNPEFLDMFFCRHCKNNVKSAYTVSTKLSSFSATSKNKKYNATATNEQSEDKRKKKKELHESHFEVKNIKRTVLEEI
ncbi:hypothetical protein P5V15_010112 [Pogonomyrmex californicus]